VAFSAGGDGGSGLLEQIKRSLTTPLGRNPNSSDIPPDQHALDSLGHLYERLPAGVRDPHAHNVGLSTASDHAVALRGCESGLNRFDHHAHREPVRTQDRLGVTVTAPGKQFEGAAAVRIGPAIVASGRHRWAVSQQAPYHLDHHNYAGGAKDSHEPEVGLRRGKTKTDRSQRRECGQLRHRWVYPGAFISHLMWHLAV
jgi:hypothetical protein